MYEWGAQLQVSGIVVGEGYRFGYKAQGDTRMMAALCAKHQLKLHVAALVASSPGPGESVSSSKAGHLLTSFSAGSGGRNSLPHILCTFVDKLCICIASSHQKAHLGTRVDAYPAVQPCHLDCLAPLQPGTLPF